VSTIADKLNPICAKALSTGSEAPGSNHDGIAAIVHHPDVVVRERRYGVNMQLIHHWLLSTSLFCSWQLCSTLLLPRTN
jgi:hypothetical protein